jgi:hypothetical protein
MSQTGTLKMHRPSSLTRSAVAAFASLLLVISASMPGLAQTGWEAYRDPALGYRIDLPRGGFERFEGGEGRVILADPGGQARITVFGEDVPAGRSLKELEEALRQSDLVDEVTYRAGGKSWFVLSGHFRDTQAPEEMVFYVKLMLNGDRSAYSTFAISYPRRLKPQYDPVVERLERSLRAPSG